MTRYGYPFLLAMQACSDIGSPSVDLRQVQSAIQGGSEDRDHLFAVGILTGRGLCSGVLLAPNLVVTARHCVEPPPPSPSIICDTTEFGSPLPLESVLVTTDISVLDSSNFVGVQQVIVPQGSQSKFLCGNDIALLILKSPFDLERYPSPFGEGQEGLPTEAVVIGYGIESPGDTLGLSIGTRRIKSGVQIICAPGEAGGCERHDIFGELALIGEFMLDDGSSCPGDSGSGAFEDNNLRDGSWHCLGVLSRGQFSEDSSRCVKPVYTRLDAWAQLLVDSAARASWLHGQSLPNWATALKSSDGVACFSDHACHSGKCFSTTAHQWGTCASECRESTCADGWWCHKGYCFPGANGGPFAGPLPLSENRSSSCAVSGVGLENADSKFFAVAIFALLGTALRRQAGSKASGGKRQALACVGQSPAQMR